jgi:hypothetical protein
MLLTATARALQHYQDYPADNDFEQFGSAVAAALGKKPREFVAAYRGTVSRAKETALESSSVAAFVREWFYMTRPEEQGEYAYAQVTYTVREPYVPLKALCKAYNESVPKYADKLSEQAFKTAIERAAQTLKTTAGILVNLSQKDPAKNTRLVGLDHAIFHNETAAGFMAALNWTHGDIARARQNMWTLCHSADQTGMSVSELAARNARVDGQQFVMDSELTEQELKERLGRDEQEYERLCSLPEPTEEQVQAVSKEIRRYRQKRQKKEAPVASTGLFDGFSS